MTNLQKITPWRNLAAATLLIMVSLGINSPGMTMFYLPVARDLGFTQAEFALYFTITTLCSALVMLVSGRILSRWRDRLRLIELAALVVNGLTIACYSLCSQLWQFYLLSVFRGLAFGFTAGVPATMIVNDWFQDKRALGTSVVFMGSGVGGILFTRVSRFIIYEYHWRSAYVVLGVFVVVMAFVVAALISPVPARMGLEPYRDGKPRKTRQQDFTTGFTLAEVLRMPLFWLFLAGVFLLNIAALSTMQNVNNCLMVDGGYSSVEAANFFTVLQITLCVCSVLTGWLLDRIGFTKVILLLSCAVVLAMVCAMFCQAVPLALGFVVFFGIGNNISSAVTSSITSETFGLKDYGRIFSIVSTTLMLGMSVGPLVAGRVYDMTGSYRNVWIMVIGLLCLVVPCYLIPYYASLKGKLERKKPE